MILDLNWSTTLYCRKQTTQSGFLVTQNAFRLRQTWYTSILLHQVIQKGDSNSVFLFSVSAVTLSDATTSAPDNLWNQMCACRRVCVCVCVCACTYAKYNSFLTASRVNENMHAAYLQCTNRSESYAIYEQNFSIHSLPLGIFPPEAGQGMLTEICRERKYAVGRTCIRNLGRSSC